jgi:hypothetical protein
MRPAVASLAALLLAGCATPSCTPTTIVVADTDRQVRLESRTEGLRTHPVSGRVEEIRRDVVERTWWVRAAGGEWIAVDEAAWRRAEPGKPLDVCR